MQQGADTTWLARMRWGAVGIATAALAVVAAQGAFMEQRVWMWACIFVAAASNVRLHLNGATPRGCVLYLLLDVALLTVLLALTGGPMNPFSVMYLVYIALSSVMSRQRWTYLIAAVSIAAFAFLFVLQRQTGMTEMASHEMHGASFQAHLYGMFIAFTLAAGLIAYFVGRLSGAIRARDAALAQATHRAEQWSKLASIASVAANTAHEMGTPLATIAVAAGEMKRALGQGDGAELSDDVELIRDEVRRCREALDRFAAVSGDPTGEALEWVGVDELADAVRSRLSTVNAERWRVDASVDRLRVPKLAFSQVVHNLAQNGFDACESGDVSLEVQRTGDQAVLLFRDEGKGMDAQTLRRSGDPFFSSKDREDRIGLGLFVARSLVEALHGSVSIESQPDHGTTVTLTLPQPQ